MIEEADYEFSLSDALSQPFMTGKMSGEELDRRIKELKDKRGNQMWLYKSENRELGRLLKMRASRIYRTKERQLKLGIIKQAVTEEKYGEVAMLRSEAARLKETLAEFEAREKLYVQREKANRKRERLQKSREKFTAKLILDLKSCSKSLDAKRLQKAATKENE